MSCDSVDLYGCVNGHLCVVCQGGARDEEITKITPGARFQDCGWLGAVNTDRSGRLLSKEGLVRLYLEHHQASWDVTGTALVLGASMMSDPATTVSSFYLS